MTPFIALISPAALMIIKMRRDFIWREGKWNENITLRFLQHDKKLFTTLKQRSSVVVDDSSNIPTKTEWKYIQRARNVLSFNELIKFTILIESWTGRGFSIIYARSGVSSRHFGDTFKPHKNARKMTWRRRVS